MHPGISPGRIHTVRRKALARVAGAFFLYNYGVWRQAAYPSECDSEDSDRPSREKPPGSPHPVREGRGHKDHPKAGGRRFPHQPNFLVRSAYLFTRAGFVEVIIDAPSDYSDGMSVEFRPSQTGARVNRSPLSSTFVCCFRLKPS